MRIYRNATIITALLTAGSFVASLILNFRTEADAYWCNLLLGILGSSFLTLITSIIGYRVERRKTFEGFSYCTQQILRNLNKYQASWTLEAKINFFLSYYEISFMEWDRYFGDFCFLFDCGGKNRNYIYNKIYQPLLAVNQKVGHHSWHFRWYKDGTARNDRAVNGFIKEIEDLIMEVKTEEYPDLQDFPEDMRDSIEVTTTTTTRNKIVEDIRTELGGEYYRLMYGTRVYNKSLSDSKKTGG